MLENIFNIISDYILAPVVAVLIPDVYAEYTLYTLEVVVKILAIVLPLLLCVAYMTYAERKIIGYIQCRLGPNRVGFFGFRLWGLGQPIADAVKLLFKEIIIPTGANKSLFRDGADTGCCAIPGCLGRDTVCRHPGAGGY